MNLHRLSTLLTAIIFFQSGLSGQENTAETTSPVPEQSSVSNTGGTQKLYTPARRTDSGSQRAFKEPALFEPTQWIAPIVVLIILVGTMIFLKQKGYFGINRHLSEGKLRIKDQIMLGNRQFLVVVEYAEKEILVGIGPGFINRVCTLSEEPKSTETPGKFDDLLEDEIESENSVK